MLNENGVNHKYVVLLFSVVAVFVIGTLVMDFNLLDLAYLSFIIVMIFRYIKIQLEKE